MQLYKIYFVYILTKMTLEKKLQEILFLINQEKYKELIPENQTDDVFYVDNIEEFNIKHNLGFDNVDLEYYKKMFARIFRNPTNVELYDLSQCNSEHARHWFFRGKFSENEIIIDEPNLINKLKTPCDSY